MHILNLPVTAARNNLPSLRSHLCDREGARKRYTWTTILSKGVQIGAFEGAAISTRADHVHHPMAYRTRRAQGVHERFRNTLQQVRLLERLLVEELKKALSNELRTRREQYIVFLRPHLVRELQLAHGTLLVSNG